MLREARIANHIAHPAIVPVEEVLDLGNEGPLVLVTELLFARTLGAHFRASGALPCRRARDLRNR